MSVLAKKGSVESNMGESTKFKPNYGTAYDSDKDVGSNLEI